jgi:hypothetical protein
MTKDKLHAQIKEKFGSLSRFAVLSKYPRMELQKYFSRKSDDDEQTIKISHLVERTAVKPTQTDITPEKIKSLHKALNEAGGVRQFCKKSKGRFAEKSVYQILDGRRKRITPKVQDLLTRLGVT